MHQYENLHRLILFITFIHLIFHHSNLYTHIKMKYKKQASSAPSCLHPHPNSHSLGATTLKTFRHFIWYLLNSSRYFVYTITSYYFKCKHYLLKMKTQCLQPTLSHISFASLPKFGDDNKGNVQS